MNFQRKESMKPRYRNLMTDTLFPLHCQTIPSKKSGSVRQFINRWSGKFLGAKARVNSGPSSEESEILALSIPVLSTARLSSPELIHWLSCLCLALPWVSVHCQAVVKEDDVIKSRYREAWPVILNVRQIIAQPSFQTMVKQPRYRQLLIESKSW